MKKRPYIKLSVRRNVLARFGGRCGYCGHLSNYLEIDHVEPFFSNFNKDDESNYMAACKPCNRFKSGMRLEEFRSELSKQAKRAIEYSVNARTAFRFGKISLNPVEDIAFYFEKRVKK